MIKYALVRNKCDKPIEEDNKIDTTGIQMYSEQYGRISTKINWLNL
jgi:hypothetical protein